MSSHCLRPELALTLALVVALAGCEREKRDLTSRPETPPIGAAVSPLRPGGGPAPAPDPRGRQYEGNAYAVSQGKRFYTWFNCVGCHAHGGGGIGPALIDDEWRYGSSIEQIYATIDQGRPNGMPSFHGKVPPQQMWQIAAYVRAMSGSVPSAANGSRGEEMANIPSPTMMKAPPPRSDPSAVTGAAP